MRTSKLIVNFVYNKPPVMSSLKDRIGWICIKTQMHEIKYIGVSIPQNATRACTTFGALVDRFKVLQIKDKSYNKYNAASLIFTKNKINHIIPLVINNTTHVPDGMIEVFYTKKLAEDKPYCCPIEYPKWSYGNLILP